MKHRLAASILIASLGGLAACGSDSKATNDSIVASDPTVLSTSAATNPETSAEPSTATGSTVSDSTHSTVSDDTASDGTDVDINARIDEARSALKDGDFSTMLSALELSGLAKEIENREITILAPTDTAFADLSAATITDLLANPTQIDNVLRDHIIDELLTFDELAAKSTVKMLSGKTRTVTKQGDVVKVDGAVVTESNSTLSGDEGQEVAVFAIDHVLLDN